MTAILMAVVVAASPAGLGPRQPEEAARVQPEVRRIVPIRPDVTVQELGLAPDREATFAIEPVPADDLAQARSWLREELDKYPADLFHSPFTVFPCKRLVVSRGRAAGYALGHGVVIVVPSAGAEDSEWARAARRLHSEIGCWMYEEYHDAIAWSEWTDANPPDFRYGARMTRRQREADGLEADDSLADGFVTGVARVYMKGDFAEVCSYLFANDPAFWTAVANNERLRKKVRVAISFFEQRDPAFTEDHFRTLAQAGTPPVPVAAGADRLELLGLVRGAPPVVVDVPEDLLAMAMPGDQGRGVDLTPLDPAAGSLVARPLLQYEAAKYPRGVFADGFAVYACKGLRRNNEPRSGVYWPNGVLVAFGEQELTPVAYEVHRQVGTWLLIANRGKFPEAAWAESLPEGFRYAAPNNEKEADDIEAQVKQALEAGFVSLPPPSLPSDFSAYVACLFMNDHRFWQAVDRYELVGKKARLALNFLAEVDPGFTEEYFRSLPLPEQ